MTRAFIALGSNLQDPAAQIAQAFIEINQLPGTTIVARSSLYRTAPLDHNHQHCNDQPDFINAVTEVATTLSPHALLQSLLAIEANHGRERPFPNAPRVLDLDLLLYEGVTLNEEYLTLPHPHMHERNFVLAPLAEIAPELEIPGRGKIVALLQKHTDQDIRKLAA